MELKLVRKYNNINYTIGKLFINNEYFCDTLEDTDRGLNDSMSNEDIANIKIKGKTAIPKGEYKVTLNVVSPKYSNYSKYKWAKDIKGKVPRILSIKGFDGVLIHPGNSAKDTEGCILVGKNKIKGMVVDSVKTFKNLYNILLEDANNISLSIQ